MAPNTSETLSIAAKRDGVLIVIPAYNEEESIVLVIEDIRQHSSADIVVVDDCSSDRTAAVARSNGVHVLSLALRLGAWGAAQAGVRYAQREHYQIVVTMDADGQHLGGELPGLLQRLQVGDGNVVIGSYPERGSPARKFAWRIFRALTGFSFQDLTSGFRAYDRQAIAAIASREASLIEYQDIGILMLLRKAGAKVVEHPVSMRPRLSGASHIFSSWLVVVLYMAETLILCLARWHVHRIRNA